ncbi:MAG: Uma2 family endonuclease, partial [Armatimonadetes bacterium]|nr:Uma2 family endonuclease [Armatimonadota bacterium]
KEYWLIDPDRRQVEFYVLNAQGVYQQAFAGAEGEYRATAVEGFWIRVEWLWNRPPMTEVFRAWGWM